MDFLGHSSGVLIGRQFFLHEYKNACSGTQQWSHLQTICFAWIEIFSQIEECIFWDTAVGSNLQPHSGNGAKLNVAQQRGKKQPFV